VLRLLPRARSSTRSGLARAARECVRLGLNFNATRARENTFSLSKRFPFSTSEYWNPRKHSAAVTHGTLMNAITFHDASGRCASAYPTQFSSSLSDLHLHFPRKVDRCRSLRGRWDHLFLLALHFHKLTLCKRSSSCISHTFFFVILRGAKLRTAMACLYLRLFTTRRYPGGCLTDFSGS
jgi:hypothetical protein